MAPAAYDFAVSMGSFPILREESPLIVAVLDRGHSVALGQFVLVLASPVPE